MSIENFFKDTKQLRLVYIQYNRSTRMIKSRCKKGQRKRIHHLIVDLSLLSICHDSTVNIHTGSGNTFAIFLVSHIPPFEYMVEGRCFQNMRDLILCQSFKPKCHFCNFNRSLRMNMSIAVLIFLIQFEYFYIININYSSFYII